MRAKVLLDCGAVLAESPQYNHKHEKLTWIDILGKKLNIFDTLTSINTQIDCEKMIGFASLNNDGTVITALEDGLYNYSNGKFELMIPLDQNGIRFNDGCYDRHRRLYIGTMAIDQTTPARIGAGNVFVFENSCLKKVIGNTTIANGITFDYKRKRMYFNDSFKKSTVMYDYCEETGDITNPKIFYDYSNEDGVPDGMTIDERGNIYTAVWGAYKVIIINPQGEKIGEIAVGTKKTSAVEFGYLKKECVLYITTAKDEYDQGGEVYYIPQKDIKI